MLTVFALFGTRTPETHRANVCGASMLTILNFCVFYILELSYGPKIISNCAFPCCSGDNDSRVMKCMYLTEL